MRTFLIILALFLLTISSGCSKRHTAEIAPPVEDNTTSKITTTIADACLQLAASESYLPGWKLASPARTYDKKSIFDYINGAAELYFAYDFRAVAAAEYQDGETSIIVDVYDMATPENAFGIYSLSRYSEANYVNVGNEGILTDANLDFWKGRYFCKVYSFDISEKYQKDVVNFGVKLASNIKEAGMEPSVLKKLPQNGLIPKTAKFFSRKLALDNIYYISPWNILKLSSETKGVAAEYDINGVRVQLFVVEYPSPNAASLAFRNCIESEAELLTTTLTAHKVLKTYKRGSRFVSIGLKDESIWSFWDVETQETAEYILRNILLFPH